MIGLKFVFDDRPDEWIDPVYEEWQEGDYLVVDNGYHEYRVPLSHIVDRIEYEIEEEV